MAHQSDSNTYPISSPATGLRRALNYVVAGAMVLLPRRLRNRVGWWTWSDVLDPRGNYSRTLDKTDRLSAQQPVATLLRRGFTPPTKDNVWPKIFNSLHKTYNSDNYWNRVSFNELRAWSKVWGKHHLGQQHLATALVGIVGSGNAKACSMLLEYGANPLACSELVMGVLWSGRIGFEKSLQMWKDITSANPHMSSETTWEKWSRGMSSTAVLSSDELEEWRVSGAPLPSPEGALRFAIRLVDDPELGYNPRQMKSNLRALSWLKITGILPENNGTELLKTWLSTARPGNTDQYQKAMEVWAEVLVTDPLPSRPAQGPSLKNSYGNTSVEPELPWSHWAMSGPFFENIPNTVREKLFDESDAWTAKNSRGETVVDVIERRIEETRNQSRDEGLNNLSQWCRSWVLRAHLTQVANRPRDHTPSSGPTPRM